MLLSRTTLRRHASRFARVTVGGAVLFGLLGCGFLGLDATSTPGGPVVATSASTSAATDNATAAPVATTAAPVATTAAPNATSVPSATSAPATNTSVPAASATSTTPAPAAPGTVQATQANQLGITVEAGTQTIQVQPDGIAAIPRSAPSATVTIHYPDTLSAPVAIKIVQPLTITWTVENQTQIDSNTVRATLHAPANAANGTFTVQATTSGYAAIHFVVQIGS